jgi:hypothetical protein
MSRACQSCSALVDDSRPFVRLCCGHVWHTDCIACTCKATTPSDGRRTWVPLVRGLRALLEHAVSVGEQGPRVRSKGAHPVCTGRDPECRTRMWLTLADHEDDDTAHENGPASLLHHQTAEEEEEGDDEYTAASATAADMRLEVNEYQI